MDGLLPTENGKLTIPDYIKKWIRIFIPFLIMGHVFSMGVTGWLSPANWHGYLFPISLIAFVVVTIFINKNRNSNT